MTDRTSTGRVAMWIGCVTLIVLPQAILRGQSTRGGRGEVGPAPVSGDQSVSVVLRGSTEQIEQILGLVDQFDGIQVEPTRFGPTGHPYDLNEPYDPSSPLQRAPHPHDYSRSRQGRYSADRYGGSFGATFGGSRYGYRGSYEEGFSAGYRQGRFYGRREMEAELKAPLFTSTYQHTMHTGAERFGAGDYSAAARHFVLAARLDNGDASSRIRGGHALVAVGRYSEAAALIARAFELQPKLPYLSRDIRNEYGQKDDFDKHLNQLAAAATEAADQADLWALLGYYEFFGGEQTRALRSLSQAETLNPQNSLARRLLEVVRLSVPPPTHNGAK